MCQQLRTRDCKSCDVFLLIPGGPIIESSTDMRFGSLLETTLETSEEVRGQDLGRIYEALPMQCKRMGLFQETTLETSEN